MKRKPTARDRDLAEFILNLPVGQHLIDVREDDCAPIKAEGGLLLHHGPRMVAVIPNYRVGWKRVTVPPK